jgi:hypothetical protein
MRLSLFVDEMELLALALALAWMRLQEVHF